MDIRVVPKGQTFEQIVRQADRKLKAANRKVASPVSRKGIQAIRSGAPRFRGKQLTAKTEVATSGSGVVITFYGVSAGGWAINESGAVAHPIRPKRARVLSFDGIYAAHVNHPGTRGHRAWTQAGDRLETAVEPAVEKVYDEAFT